MKWPLLAGIVVVFALVGTLSAQWNATAQEGTLPEPTVAPEPTPDAIGTLTAKLDEHAAAQRISNAHRSNAEATVKAGQVQIQDALADLDLTVNNWGVVTQQDLSSIKNMLIQIASVPTPEPGVIDRIDQWQEAFDQWTAQETATALTPVAGGVSIEIVVSASP